MKSTKRLIPRRASAPISFGDTRRGARSGAPSWLGAAAVAGACLASVPADAAADPGSVELRNGGRVSGELVAVAPNDRVVVLLADGSTMTFPWSEVQFVFDGERVFDADGNVALLPAAPPPPVPPVAPAAATPPAPPAASLAPRSFAYPGPYGYGPPSGVDPALMTQYLNLPRRGGSVALATFGGLLIAEGVLTISLGATYDCYGFFGGYSYGGGYGYSGESDGTCGFRKWMIGSGTVNAGIGALMTGFAVRRLHRRARSVRELRSQGMLIVDTGTETDTGLEVTLDVDAGPGRLVPHLRLRF